jgi:hypothetical protein
MVDSKQQCVLEAACFGSQSAFGDGGDWRLIVHLCIVIDVFK